MKALLFLFVICLPTLFYAQEIDARLLENQGDTIYRIHKQKHNYYQYLKFEIDFAYSLKSKDEVNVEQKKHALDANSFKNAQGKRIEKSDVVQGVFNFKAFGIQLVTDKELVIKLDNKTYLVFVSRSTLGEQFQRSLYYTK